MICLIEHVFQTKQVLDLSVFNMMARISNLKISTKHVSCKCKYKFDGKICNSNQRWNNNKCWCECKYPREQDACKKDYICNPATFACEYGKYVGRNINDSVIMCDEVIWNYMSYEIKLYFTCLFINYDSILDSC